MLCSQSSSCRWPCRLSTRSISCSKACPKVPLQTGASMRGSEMVSFALWYDSFLVDSCGICQQQCRVLELIWLEWFDLCSVQCDRVILCFFMFFPKWQNMVVQRLHACHLAEFAAGVLCKSRNSRHGSLPYLTGCRNRRTCWTCTILNKYIYICVDYVYIYRL